MSRTIFTNESDLKRPRIIKDWITISNRVLLIEDLINIYKNFASPNVIPSRLIPLSKVNQIKKLNGTLISMLANYINIDYYAMLISNVFYDENQDVASEICNVFTFYSYKIVYKVYNEIIIKNNNKFRELYKSNLEQLKERLTILNSSIFVNNNDNRYLFLLNDNNELILFNRKTKHWYGSNKKFPLFLLNFKFQKEKEESSNETKKQNEYYPFISIVIKYENNVGDFENSQNKEYIKLLQLHQNQMYGMPSEIGQYFDRFGYDYDNIDILKKDLVYRESSASMLGRKRIEEKLALEKKNNNELSSLSTELSSATATNYHCKLSDIILKEILFRAIQFKITSHIEINFIDTTTTLRNLALVSKQFLRIISNIIRLNYYEWNNSSINFGIGQFNLFQDPPLFFDYDSIIKIPYDISDEKLQSLFSRVETFHYNCDGFLFDLHFRCGWDDGYSDCEDRKVDKDLMTKGYFVFPPLKIPSLKNLYVNFFGDYSQTSNRSYITFVTSLLIQYSVSLELFSIEFFSMSNKILEDVLNFQGGNHISLKTFQIVTRDYYFLFKLLDNLYKIYEGLDNHNLENLRIEIKDTHSGVFIENWNPFYDISKDETNLKKFTDCGGTFYIEKLKKLTKTVIPTSLD